jgi:methyl-branched lipid omega-hydroxylase
MDHRSTHLADSAFWKLTQSERLETFEHLRANEPVKHFGALRSEFSRECTAFWALTRYEDVWNVSRNPKTYCSRLGIDIESNPAEMSESVNSMINFDDPKHARMRRLVSAGFTPKRTAQLDRDLRATATSILDDVLDRFGDGSEFDFVEQVAVRLPLAAISDMLGIPADEQAQVLAWTNTGAAIEDPDVGIEGAVTANKALTEYALELGRSRREKQTDDLVSVLMHAEVDGERLSAQEFANFFNLLVVAGNETTRNAISHGIRLLTLYPDQRKTWFENFDTYAYNAADEIVRFETPITHMARVLTEDSIIRGVPISAGEKVVLWYTSANRDAEVFTDADRFDITRSLTPQQVGFGGGGPHFCLGANLARREIVVMFDEIRCRTPDLHITGEPTNVLSMSLNNVMSMSARVR